MAFSRETEQFEQTSAKLMADVTQLTHSQLQLQTSTAATDSPATDQRENEEAMLNLRKWAQQVCPFLFYLINHFPFLEMLL